MGGVFVAFLALSSLLGASITAEATPIADGPESVLSWLASRRAPARPVDSALLQARLGPLSEERATSAGIYSVEFDPESESAFIGVVRDRGAVVDRTLGEASGTSAKPQGGRPPAYVVMSRYSSQEIESALNQVEAYLAKGGITAGFSYEVKYDAIVVKADASSLKDRTVPSGMVEVITLPGEGGEAIYNENMSSPFKGGGAIYSRGAGRCTSGIVAKNDSGYPGYFTAAHCYPAHAEVYSSSDYRVSSHTGKVTHTFGAAHVDAHFVSGKSYVGRIYSENSAPLSRVIGSWHPEAADGNRICFTGSTSGSPDCRNYINRYGGRVCYKEKCYRDIIEIGGGPLVKKGDSGGPVFAHFGSSVRVTGIISGYHQLLPGLAGVSYITDWRGIRQAYGASLVLG